MAGVGASDPSSHPTHPSRRPLCARSWGSTSRISSFQAPFTHFWDKNKSVSQKTKSVSRIFHRFSLNLRRRIWNRHQAYLGLFGGRKERGVVCQHVGKTGGKRRGLCPGKRGPGTKKDCFLIRGYCDALAHSPTPETQVCRVLMGDTIRSLHFRPRLPFFGTKISQFRKKPSQFPGFFLFFPEFTPKNPEPAPSVFRLVWREDREGGCGLARGKNRRYETGTMPR